MKKSWQSYSKVAPVAERTSREGILFHSKTELLRWEYLKLRERIGEIKNLRRQVKFTLESKCCHNGVTIMAGDNPAVYTADFVYDVIKIFRPKGGPFTGGTYHEVPKPYDVIEDVKGYRDEASKFRIRVFEALHGRKVDIVKKIKGGKWVTSE